MACVYSERHAVVRRTGPTKTTECKTAGITGFRKCGLVVEHSASKYVVSASLHADSLLGWRAIYIGEAHPTTTLHTARIRNSTRIRSCIGDVGARDEGVDGRCIDPILPVVVEVREQTAYVDR